MELHIVTPKSKKSIAVNWLELNTPEGNLIIQTGHAPTVLTLLPGKEIIYEHANGKKENMTIQDGLVHVNRTSATIIINR